MAFSSELKDTVSKPGSILSETTVGADLYSTVYLRKRNVNLVAFQVVIDAGTLAGNYYIQESNDGSNWVNVEFDDGSTAQAVSGSDINTVHHVLTSAKFLGVFFDYTSGTGTAFDVTVSHAHSSAT